MSSRHGRRVLVLGSDTRAFLSVVRSLGRRGLAVEIAWCPREALARRSRYVSAAHDLPIPTGGDDDVWLQPFIDLIRSRTFALVIPCDDPTIVPLQAHRDELEPLAPFYLLSPQAFETTMSKELTYELARKVGIPLPEQQVVTKAAELQAAADRFGFPLVLKPDRSFAADDLVTRQTHVKVRSPQELAAATRRVPGIVQEHVSGEGIGLSVLACEGTILVAFQHRREHEPLIGGGSSYRSSVALDPRLLAAADKLIDALSYTGVAMIEFKADARTGRWALIEINGRFWGSLPLALAAGVDFPYYLYELLVHGRRSFPARYRTGVYCRNLGLDYSWTLDNLRADATDPILMTRPLRRVVRDALRFVTLREHNDTLTRDDPVPGLVEISGLVGAVLAHRREALATRAIQRPGISRLGRAAAARRLRRARTIAVIGGGTLRRGSFAEQYFHSKRIADVEVACLVARSEHGRTVPLAAREAARRFDVDLDNHVPRPLSAETLGRADVIWVFDRRQRRLVESTFPASRRKLQYLGLFDPQGGVMIGDAEAGGGDALAAVYGAIARAVDVAAEEITRSRR